MVNSLEPVRFTGGLWGFLHYVYACHGGWLRWQLLEFKCFFGFFFFGTEGKGKGSLILQVGDFLIASKAC